MKVLVAVDSFKGSVTSREINKKIAESIHHTSKKMIAKSITVADGGEGSLEAIYDSSGGEFISMEAVDLCRNPITVNYLLIKKETKKIAYIEVADLLGLHLINPSESTIIQTSSDGLGIMIKKMLKTDIDTIIVMLGGTGCSDGGLGMLRALGCRIYDKDNFLLEDNNPLLLIDRIDFSNIVSEINKVELIGSFDVSNSYVGNNNGFEVFSKQKGASKNQIDNMMENSLKVSTDFYRFNNKYLLYDIGTGAAGGIGGAISMLGGKLSKGFDLIANEIGLEKSISTADLIITGEGSMDRQSLNGKLPYSMGLLAKKYNKPIIAICGKREASLGEMNNIFSGVFSIQNTPIGMEESMKKEVALNNIDITVETIFKLINVFID